MIKRIALYSLAEGVDGDHRWEHHTNIHAPAFAREIGIGLKRYVINRVSKIVNGKPKFYVMAEMWWESRDAMNQAIEMAKVTKAPSGMTFFNDSESEIIDSFAALVEEVQIGDAIAGGQESDKLVKRLSMSSTKEGVDQGILWRYYTQIHGPAFLRVVGASARKYLINRVSEVIYGKQIFDRFSEVWWESEEAMNRCLEICRVTKAPSGNMMFGDLKSQVFDGFKALLEECVIKE